MMEEKKFIPKAMSLEDIVRQQEMAKYGQLISVSVDKHSGNNTIIPVKIGR